MIAFPLGIFLALAIYDAFFTITRIEGYGIRVELNPVIRRLSESLSVEAGTFIGVLVPTLILLLVGWFVHPLAWFMLGCRATLFYFQVSSPKHG